MTKTEYIYKYNLNRLRKEHKISYPKLEDLTGIARPVLMRLHSYKKSNQPKYCFDRFEAFAIIYGVEVYELFLPPEDIVYPDWLEQSYYNLDGTEYLPKRYTNPNRGHFETNALAREWYLVDPDGKEYHFKNMQLWADQHEDLLPISKSTGQRIRKQSFVREIRRLKQNKSEKNNFYGWTIRN